MNEGQNSSKHHNNRCPCLSLKWVPKSTFKIEFQESRQKCIFSTLVCVIPELLSPILMILHVTYVLLHYGVMIFYMIVELLLLLMLLLESLLSLNVVND